MLAGLYAERTGDDATIVELWPAIEAALAWIDGPGDPDGDGFIEYYRATEEGLANQGVETIGSTPDEFARLIREEWAKWEKVIKAAGLKGQV